MSSTVNLISELGGSFQSSSGCDVLLTKMDRKINSLNSASNSAGSVKNNLKRSFNGMRTADIDSAMDGISNVSLPTYSNVVAGYGYESNPCSDLVTLIGIANAGGAIGEQLGTSMTASIIGAVESAISNQLGSILGPTLGSIMALQSLQRLYEDFGVISALDEINIMEACLATMCATGLGPSAINDHFISLLNLNPVTYLPDPYSILGYSPEKCSKLGNLYSQTRSKIETSTADDSVMCDKKVWI